jgi:hypothetical protein
MIILSYYYKLTPLNILLLEKLIVPRLLNKLPPFYGNQRLIVVFTAAHHWVFF